MEGSREKGKGERIMERRKREGDERERQGIRRGTEERDIKG